MQHFYAILLLIIAYLLGSINFAVPVSKLLRLPDPRSYGSGNPGANNVMRSGSKAAALLTLFFDALKAFVPLFVLKLYASAWSIPDFYIPLAGFAAFLGHLYPIFFNFKGGKGVASALGVLFAIHWGLALLCLLCFVIVAYLWRYSSLASMTAAVVAPCIYLLAGGDWWQYNSSTFVVLVVMALWLIYRHRANIDRLIKGKEGKIGKKAV